MTKTEKNFIPMLLLASGSFGSAADATIITQSFDPGATMLDITSTGAYSVSIPGADTKYSIYAVSSQSKGGGKKSMPTYTTDYYFRTALQGGGAPSEYTYFSPVNRIGTANDVYTTKDSPPLARPGAGGTVGSVSYAQLRFDLDGVKTYGVVAVQDARMKSVSYEVVDAVAPVPEPAVWAEMIVGLGAVGAAMRKRRRLARSIAA